MSVFDAYAAYYDLLYQEKDYAGEAAYVHSLLQHHALGVRDVLELGCGTGAHAEHLARMDYNVHGVDLSEAMLARAGERRAAMPSGVANLLSFGLGDVRTVRTGNTYDAVISLFHVVSYQAKNSDLQAMFATAREHLRPGGLFIFDVWYGPAVLTDQPAVRVKELENDVVKITRVAQPTMYFQRNLVDVHYRIIACEKNTGCYSETEETHRMRYLFSPEIELLAKQAGFDVVEAQEWMTGKKPGVDTWGVCFICQITANGMAPPA